MHALIEKAKQQRGTEVSVDEVSERLTKFFNEVFMHLVAYQPIMDRKVQFRLIDSYGDEDTGERYVAGVLLGWCRREVRQPSGTQGRQIQGSRWLEIS